MVKVEVALLPISKCDQLDDLDELLVAVGNSENDRSPGTALQLAGTVVQRLSTTEIPVALPDIGWAPSLLRALWPRLWTSARTSLSLRTVFAAESLDAASPPKIAVFPAELMPRWRGHPILEGPEQAVGPASQWFGGDASPQLERLLQENSERLPGEFSVLVRVERIVERLERLHDGRGTISDALVVARTQEAFPAGFHLPPEDLQAMSNALTGLSEASPGDIRTASLTRLEHVTNRGEVETALAAWIEARMPEAEDQDALWILQHHLSPDHTAWWRTGVGRGLATAFEQRRPDWARALWRWWARQPSAIDWLAEHIDGSDAVEAWLANSTPEEVNEDLIKKLVEVCGKHSWATLLARVLGTGRPLVDCIGTMRDALLQPEVGIEALVENRGDTEIVTAAAATNWSPLIVRAAEVTQNHPRIFGRVRDMPGLVPLLVAHLNGGGNFPSELVRSDFLTTTFDGVLRRDPQLEDVAGHLGASAGAFALEHPSANQLFSRINSDVVSGAAEEWWTRFLADERVDAPPSALRSAVIGSARARCDGGSITLIVRLLEVIPEVPEDTFVEWMTHTGFFWAGGDHQRVANLLLERDWRSAATSFRRSWKQELKVVAWHARDILAWSDRFWWGALAGVDTIAAVAPPPSTNIVARRQMKITFLASNPFSSDRLALHEEARLIEEKVRDAKHRDLVTFKTRWAVRPEDLQQALLEDEPVVVHFSGHGGGAVGIVLHSQDPDSEQLVAEDALADLFRALKDGIQVVVLNACYSEVQAKAIVQEIDFVVGMSDSVDDEAARLFAAAFYRGLAFGRSVRNAFDLGINELQLLGLSHEKHIPQLLVRTGADPWTTKLVGPTSS